MFGRKKPLPAPTSLPATCPDCGARLKWETVSYLDPVIGVEKVDHFKAECSCGKTHYRDVRGQAVEPAVVNLPPDRSEFANSPQGPQPYSGFLEFVKQEREKAEALKKAQAAKAAAAAGGAGASPAAGATEARPAPAAPAPSGSAESS